ncbi:MAG: CotH kinase family protein [Ginsengibacter sp.]
MIKKYLLSLIIIILIGIAPQFVQGQNEIDFSINGLPVVHIDLLDSGAVITKEEILIATMRIENANGSNFSEKDLYNGRIEISGRGTSTWNMPKKPYKIELIKENGEDNPSSLLGMPADEDWALIANYADKSLMRVSLAYYLGNAMGMEYSPKTRFVEIYLNKEYLGIYDLSENIKKADKRVNIAKLSTKPEDQAEPAITGGYLVEVTPFDRIESDEKYVTTDSGVSVVFKYPKSKNITNAQIDWFGQYINKVETVLYGENFKDPVNGYRKYIDVPSFINWYLVNDFAKNGDANFYASVYMYKDRGGKLKMGPLWDFDIAFGNINYNADALVENGFYVKHGRWFERLLQDEYFQQKVSERFDQVKSVFDSIPGKIAAASETLKRTGGIDRNFQKWPILGTLVWPNYPPFPNKYDGEIRRLSDWCISRTNWLNIYLPLTAAEQCKRLQTTKPHISIVNTDEFEVGLSTKIKTTAGFNKYFWNGVEQANDTMNIIAGEKYRVEVADSLGCKSLVSDTLHYIQKAKINVDSTNFEYDGFPKSLHTSTIPEDLPVIVTYNDSVIPPVLPGEYKVRAIIHSAFYKDSVNTNLIIRKIKQEIIFSQIPSLIYVPEGILMNAHSSSDLPVQFILSGKGIIKENKLEPIAGGELVIKAFQPGNEFYEGTDTLIQKTWAEYSNNFKKNIQIFPTPFDHSVTIIYPFADKTNMTIYTQGGRRIKETILTGNRATLNLSFLSKGVYIIHLESSKGQGDFKVLKQ